MTIPSSNEPITLRFSGGGITPSNMHARELADMLTAAEDLVTAAVLQEYSELTKDDIIVSLTTVTEGSLSLGFSPSLPDIVIPAFERLGEAIHQQDFGSLSNNARDALRAITTFTRRNRCTAELWVRSRSEPLTTIDPNLVIPAAPRLFVQTTLYGRVLNAGGKTPNVHLETLDGKVVVCGGTQQQVKTLAEHLYTWVGLNGRARCDVETLAIYDFDIDDILPYADFSITSAMRELEALAAPHFAGVDAAGYVQALRDDMEE